MNWLNLINFFIQLFSKPMTIVTTETTPVPSIDTLTPEWTLPKNAYHNVRVLCDLAGLTVEEKNLICACIFQESQFNNAAICKNKNSLGQVTSIDYGICQINSHYHIGPKLDFPSVQYVLDNPVEVVKWMISMYKAGKLSMWVSFSSGAYRQWLVDSSPMWALSTK